jgi:hypothetical protein
VLYTTDNGPHGNSWPDAAITPFRSEKATNWEGAFRVPCMIRWPGHIYFMVFYNTKDAGPLVIDVPSAEGGIFAGNIDTVWQMPLEDVGPFGADQGQGGKYLILPPDYKGDEILLSGPRLIRRTPQTVSVVIPLLSRRMTHRRSTASGRFLFTMSTTSSSPM